MSVAEELNTLDRLRRSGGLSEKEYQEAKASVLARSETGGEQPNRVSGKISSEVSMWGMFIHLSQFCGYVVPLAGLIVPIVLWQVKKKEAEIIDVHGRIVVNWIITQIILASFFGILCLVLIGIPLLMGLGVLSIIFPIVGAIKAKDGDVWPYPFSIRFFKVYRYDY